MKKRVLCYTLLFIFSLSSYSQTTKNCKSVHALPIIEKGIKLVDSTEFDEAIILFTSVPIGDSLYARAQYELAYAYSKMQKYDETVKICQYLIHHPDQYINSSLVEILLANSYSDLNNFEKALEIYDLGIQQYHYNNQLHFNKGIVFMKMKDYDQAIACFEKAVFCCPAHQGSHYRLGLAYLQKGYTIPGILALNYAALLRPNSEYAINALQTIDAIYAEGINTYHANIPISDETAEKNAKYKKIMTLIQANFALNKQYKIKSKINHILAKQNQLLFEMVEPIDSYELVDRLYIPYFKSVLQDNSYNTFSYFLMSGTHIENGKVKEKAMKMQKEISIFVDKMKKNLDETIAKGVCVNNKEQYTYFYDNQYNLSAFGKVEIDGKGNKSRNGQWCYLKSSGALSEIGNFVDNQQHGLFTIYNGRGNITQEVPWKNGKIEGLGKTYYIGQTSQEKPLEMEIEYVDG
ncbi:MAG: tetratricopeptide repeat protein, partial [Bacteroidales bacterium]